ncbi:hypothetical protein ACO0LB_17935 [Undibacterium sp. SXout7W]|uniref:hypothetical protein n=1 Tax=Undibacterium sp. SXout7W TaxID=3413049 RepID=UPI003BEFCF70
MLVSIKYPGDFPLKGWDKGIFDIRVTGMFRRKYVDICTLQVCRKQIKLEDALESQLQADLRELHCVNFSENPSEILDELRSKIGEYVGVEVHRSYRLPLLTIAGWLAIGLVIAGLGWGVSKVFDQIETQKRERIEQSALDTVIPLAPYRPSAIVGPTMVSDSESPKILDASVTTTSPAKAIHQFANAITESGKKFDVVVTVTPSSD